MFIGEFYLACCVAWSMPEWIVKSPDYFGQIIVIFIECGYINGHMGIPMLVLYLLLRKMCIVRH